MIKSSCPFCNTYLIFKNYSGLTPDSKNLLTYSCDNKYVKGHTFEVYYKEAFHRLFFISNSIECSITESGNNFQADCFISGTLLTFNIGKFDIYNRQDYNNLFYKIEYMLLLS